MQHTWLSLLIAIFGGFFGGVLSHIIARRRIRNVGRIVVKNRRLSFLDTDGQPIRGFTHLRWTDNTEVEVHMREQI